MHCNFVTSVLAVGLVAASCSQAAPAARQSVPVGAIYTLNNSPRNASIIAMGISENGTIFGSPVSTPTGGRGLAGVTGPGQPNVGALFGSNAVVVEDDYIFTINAGSNTVSMFYIKPFDPLHPVLVGRPASTLGQFPMSVAYSSVLSTLCVLNGGAIAGVTCFNVDPVAGLTTTDRAPRSISQGLNQTTPPTGPFSTASDIQFNPSSSALVVSVKGSPLTKPVSSGYLFAWPVTSGRVGRTAVISKLPSLILDFSLTFVGTDFDLFITDPALGGDFLSVNSTLGMAVTMPVNITYQKAACWSYYEPSSQTIFVADAAQSNITAVSAVDGSIVQTINFTPSLQGGQDMVVVGNSMYVISSSGPVVNIDIAGFSSQNAAYEVQTFNPLQGGPSARDVIAGIGAYMVNSGAA